MTELGFTIIEEGEEPEEFWILLGGKEDYGSMLDGKLLQFLWICRVEKYPQK